MRAWFARIIVAALALNFGAGALQTAPAASKPESATRPAGQSSSTPAPSAQPPAPEPDTAPDQTKAGLSPEQELANLVSQSGRSPIDLVRELERYLLRYPESKHKAEITRAIYSGARELNDDRRVAIYGERLLEKDPNEIGVLGPTARALNTFQDPESAGRALVDGQRLEKLAREALAASDEESSGREKTKRQFDLNRILGDSLLIQANANGNLGKTDEAIRLAAEAFDVALNSESARARARWLEKAGRFDEATMALTDAFALPDSSEAHMQDRARMGELYRKTHPNTVGLGDILLAEYDRVTAIAGDRNKKLGNTPKTKPIQFRLSNPQGGPELALDSLRGKVVVMDFWATWCQPCRAQRPFYEQLEERFKGDDRVVFLAINSDEERDRVPGFLKQQKYDMPVYYEDGLTLALSVTSLPTTVLLDKQGELFSKVVGFSPVNFVDLLSDRIREALNSKGGGVAPIAAHSN
jgi:thiol-disulfide isomerase/thioredoxin